MQKKFFNFTQGGAPLEINKSIDGARRSETSSMLFSGVDYATALAMKPFFLSEGYSEKQNNAHFNFPFSAFDKWRLNNKMTSAIDVTPISLNNNSKTLIAGQWLGVVVKLQFADEQNRYGQLTVADGVSEITHVITSDKTGIKGVIFSFEKSNKIAFTPEAGIVDTPIDTEFSVAPGTAEMVLTTSGLKGSVYPILYTQTNIALIAQAFANPEVDAATLADALYQATFDAI
jgi:hypothetical protein